MVEKEESALFPSGLYLAATPIGHARDVTLRVLDLLRTCDVLVCEDTRVVRRLLAIYGIKGKVLWPYNDHNAHTQIPKIMKCLTQKEDVVALVSDAGTPLVSDPGFKLVHAAIEYGAYVTSLPGACSPVVALTLSGLAPHAFKFYGFMPRTPRERAHTLEDVAYASHTSLFFETPQRLLATLRGMIQILGKERAACIARELTKKFETLYRGTLDQLNTYITHAASPLKGEIIIVVGPYVSSQDDNVLEGTILPRNENSSLSLALSLQQKEAIRELLHTLSIADAARILSHLGWGTRGNVYKLLHSIRG